MNQPQYAPPPASQFDASLADPPRAPWTAARITVGGLAASAFFTLVSTLIAVAVGDDGAANLGSRAQGGFTVGAAVDAAATIIDGIVFFATGIMFIVWLYQARRNAERLGSEPGWARGWTIGGWFVPFANFVIPVRVVRDVADASVPAVAVEDVPDLRYPPIGWWWAAWIAMVIMGRLSAGSGSASTTSELVAHSSTDIGMAVATAALTIVAAALASLVVLRITNSQRIAAEIGAHR